MANQPGGKQPKGNIVLLITQRGLPLRISAHVPARTKAAWRTPPYMLRRRPLKV